MVGMPDLAVRESRQRIKSALMNSGFTLSPQGRPPSISAPANIRKEGAGFDLPIAMGILGAMGAVTHLDQHLLMGELSLDGKDTTRAGRAIGGGLRPRPRNSLIWTCPPKMQRRRLWCAR